MKKIFFTFLFSCAVFLSFGQIQVTPDVTANQLAHTLVGAGISYSNAVLNCPNGASGLFGQGILSMGLDSGIVLTTGNITGSDPTMFGNKFGLDTAATEFNSTDNLAPGDPDLNTYNITIENTHDACALEFDVIPICDTLRFKYVFASEEYPEYVDAGIADAFAFFISGPGLTGVQDIAFIPGTNTIINIDSVNAGNFDCPPGGTGFPTGCTNCSYYVNNCGGTNFVYDGYTTVLPAEIIVAACSTYHVKLVIADGSDGVFDSGVFLQKGTLSCFGVSIVASTFGSSGIDAVEGCQTGQFQMCLSQAPASDFTFHFTIGGTATLGVDYQGIPDSIVFPMGVACVTMDIFPFVDTFAEGSETVMLYYQPSLCGLMDSAYINILDIYQVNAGPDASYCPGDSAQIGPLFVPGTSYTWTPSTGLSSDTIARPWVSYINTDTLPVVLGYRLSTTIGGCSNSDSVYVTAFPFPAPQAGVDTTVCSGQTIQIGTPSKPLHTYLWSPTTGIAHSDSSLTDITLSNASQSPVTTTYYLTSNLGGCTSTDSMQITVHPVPTSDAGSDIALCSGASTVMGTAPVSGYNYSWMPSTGLSSGNISNPSVSLINITSAPVTHNYVLVAGWDNCSDVDSVTVTVKPIPVSDAGSDITICPGIAGQIGSAGSAGNNYSWSPATGLDNPTTSNPSIILDNSTSSPASSSYIVLTGLSGCNSSDTVDVTVKGTPVAAIYGPDTVCINQTGTVVYNGAALDNPSYAWNFGDAQVQTGTLAGPYTLRWTELGRKTISLVVSESDCPSAPDSISFEVIDCDLEVPNIVTPDGDGMNDYFHILNMEKNPNSKLIIYSRWGRKVYETDYYKNDWNGGSSISAGVYFYVLKLNDGTEKHGFITIVK